MQSTDGRLQSIGILSRLLVHIEENPSEAELSRGTPVYWMAQCLAAYAPGLPDKLREDLKESVESDEALHAAQEELFKIAVFRALAGTTQAVTLVNGGVKANALPEQARAVINHRIASDRFASSNLKLCRAFFWIRRLIIS